MGWTVQDVKTSILRRGSVADIAAVVILLGTGQLAIGIGRRPFISALGAVSFAWPVAGIAVLDRRQYFVTILRRERLHIEEHMFHPDLVGH
jgi:hypothetical protein